MKWHFIVVVGCMAMAGCREAQVDRQEAAKMLAAQNAVRNRYSPSPKLMDVLQNPSKPCSWTTTRNTTSCAAGQECWTVKCDAVIEPKLSEKISAEWLVEEPSLAEMPMNEAAKTLFVKKQ